MNVNDELRMTNQLEKSTLVYVNDTDPGYKRQKCGRGFTYFHPDGTRVKDKTLRERFNALVIPPAWSEVWICLEPNGHIQSTGRDDAGRKQYIYHPDWETMRNQAKFARVYQFGSVLPKIRKTVDADLRRHHLPREKVLALTVALLDEIHIRIGNSSYAQQNGSFGLTTLQDDHVDVSTRRAVFDFTGKSGVERHIDLKNPRLARLVKACQELPGQHLFQYEDEEGNAKAIESGDVNGYLRTIAGEEYSAKDFRTWAGTVAAVEALHETLTALRAEQEKKEEISEKEREKHLVAMVKEVAEVLGNTPAVCRKYYIHPAIFDAYLSDTLVAPIPNNEQTNGNSSPDADNEWYRPAERAVLKLLKSMGYE